MNSFFISNYNHNKAADINVGDGEGAKQGWIFGNKEMNLVHIILTWLTNFFSFGLKNGENVFQKEW